MAFTMGQARSLVMFVVACILSLIAQGLESEPLTDWSSVPADEELNSTLRKAPPTSSTPPTYCRYWAGYTDRKTYTLITCQNCYHYQFHTLLRVNGTFLEADIHNDTLKNTVCQTLETTPMCEQWVACCLAAEECCDQQQSAKSMIDRYSQNPSSNDDYCPSTWDGYACWQDVPAGQTDHSPCAWYIPMAIPSADAYKTCTANGTWFAKSGDKEWTNFTTCYNFDGFKTLIYIKLACNAVSLLVLIPSLIIFLSFRTLRKQHRIRLHINLFLSFILYALINIFWEVFVVKNRLDETTGDSLMDSNSGGCHFLYVLTRYTSTCTYVWMFCEGLYLHRLIVKAFQPPKKLFIFYILGWGFPWIPISIYSVIRLYKGNESCWVHQIGGYEWFIYVPNLMALLTNLGFLIDILRILLTQIQSHPNEPSNYRRALKATFVLVPLFGLQLFLVIYRPPLGSVAGDAFEKISAVVVNTQGFFVALIFCLINGEVHANIKRSCNRFGLCMNNANNANRMYTNNTQTSDVFTRDSPTSSFRATENPNANGGKKSYIAMKPVGNNNGYLN